MRADAARRRSRGALADELREVLRRCASVQSPPTVFDSVSDAHALRMRRARTRSPTSRPSTARRGARASTPIASRTAVMSATAAVAAVRAAAERRVAEAAAVPRDDAVAGVGEHRHLLEPDRVRCRRRRA